MDSIYLGANLELGALEIGSKKNDGTKDLSDGYYKLPIVMKDMLKGIVDKDSSIRNGVNIIGYNIQGKDIYHTKIYLHTLDNKLSYMNIDTPAGYITHIRRLQKLPYPTSNDDYIARMPALLTVAYNGFKTMNHTLSKIQSCKSQIGPIILAQDDFLLPPTIKPSSSSPSKASNSTTASTSSS